VKKKTLSKSPGPFLFDLDGTLIDSVYQHVPRLARSSRARRSPAWPYGRIHRRIGMSGGLFVNALLRETGRPVSAEQAAEFSEIPFRGLSKNRSTRFSRFPAPETF